LGERKSGWLQRKLANGGKRDRARRVELAIVQKRYFRTELCVIKRLYPVGVNMGDTPLPSVGSGKRNHDAAP
jgi:hypothetical protein